MLVLLALAPEQLALRVVPLGAFELAERHRDLEAREVAARGTPGGRG